MITYGPYCSYDRDREDVAILCYFSVIYPRGGPMLDLSGSKKNISVYLGYSKLNNDHVSPIFVTRTIYCALGGRYSSDRKRPRSPSGHLGSILALNPSLGRGTHLAFTTKMAKRRIRATVVQHSRHKCMDFQI